MDYKKKRKQLKLTQSAVALKLEVSLVTWQLIERGITRNPQPETRRKIDELFGKESVLNEI